MAAKLQWVAAHAGATTILTCGHSVDAVLPLGAEHYCAPCMLGFTAQLDQELAAAAEHAPTRIRPAPRFPLGRLVATPGALAALLAVGATPAPYVTRHAAGDWGDVGAADWAANDRDLVDGERLLSAYHLPDGTRLWVITEWDRSQTTILTPGEY